MIDKDTVKRIAAESGADCIETGTAKTITIIADDSDEFMFTAKELQAYNTAILKEAHAGNEAVGMKMTSEHYAKTDGRFHFVWWAEVPYGSKLYLSPPTQEAEALKAKLEKQQDWAKAALPLIIEARDALPAISLASAKLHNIDLSLASRMDDFFSVDNTNELLQEPNTWSE